MIGDPVVVGIILTVSAMVAGGAILWPVITRPGATAIGICATVATLAGQVAGSTAMILFLLSRSQ